MKIKLILFFSVLCFGCSKVVPRKPINPKASTTILQETVKESKMLNKIEDEKIINLIKRDSVTSYQVSKNGFWYTYIVKLDEEKPTPKSGNEVIIEYNLTDLDDVEIYSKQELGVKKYKVDKKLSIPKL